MDKRENHGETRQQLSSQTCTTPSQCKHTNVIPTNIDHIPSNSTHSGSGAMLCVFEDNEAVIKMIIKGRSPTMRHVSRTHRVALDWLFDRINLDSKIQIRYVDTKNQLEQSSSFVQYQPFQLHLLHQDFQFDKLLHNGEEDTRSKRRIKGCVQVATSSDESIFFHCDKFLHRIEPDCISKSGDADSFGETRQQDEFKLIRRSVERTNRCTLHDQRVPLVTG